MDKHRSNGRKTAAAYLKKWRWLKEVKKGYFFCCLAQLSQAAVTA